MHGCHWRLVNRHFCGVCSVAFSICSRLNRPGRRHQMGTTGCRWLPRFASSPAGRVHPSQGWECIVQSCVEGRCLPVPFNSSLRLLSARALCRQSPEISWLCCQSATHLFEDCILFVPPYSHVKRTRCVIPQTGVVSHPVSSGQFSASFFFLVSRAVV